MGPIAVARSAKALRKAVAAWRAAGERIALDYFEARDAETLALPAEGRPPRLLVAAWLPSARLIDDIPV